MAAFTHTSTGTLEFEILREMLREYANSPLGQGRVSVLSVSADRAWIEHQHRLTNEIREFLRAGGRFDFSGLLETSRLIEKSRIAGAALEPPEIRDIVFIVEHADEWRHLVSHPPSQMRHGFATVAELTAAIPDFTEFLRFFRNKIQADGTLEDRASRELAHIRREVEKQRRAIQESLQGYVRQLAAAGTVQEELITIRGERFVIPVKVEQKKRVNGVVHGVSSSGQTVFIEPLETIEQNNELVRLLDEEQAEIRRILREMTQRIAARADAIAASSVALAELELQFAKARFADDYACVAVSFSREHEGTHKLMEAGDPPSATSERRLILRNARHPLLERSLRSKQGHIVPITLELEGDHHQVIISGPNTGGKTVALKTVGLLALMAQAGIPVPAERVELPIFDSVLADIGDYQSIEQNLSTFSAHVTNIDSISRTATPRSLVLLDELGSATDPAEGSALAIAIADYFRRLGCFSVISTHHTSLKVYAAQARGVLNAAVGFDEKTLLPTYELKTGIPGASAGINIAQRLGLHAQIIDTARAQLGSETQDVSRLLDRLHGDLRTLEQERGRLQRQEQELARERKRLEAEGMKEHRQRVRELERKVDAVLRDFEYRAREVVQAIQDRAASLKLSKDAERRIARLRREFKEQFDSTVVAHATGADIGDPNARPSEVKQVAEGDTVKLRSLGRNALIARKIDDNNFEVEMGALKMRVPRSDISEVVARASDSPVTAARARGFAVSLTADAGMTTEINVIGQTVDAATAQVEKFLDRAFLAGLSRVRIVHGSGMGILRKALRQYLQSHPHVASLTEPPQNEGGAGATVVELRT